MRGNNKLPIYAGVLISVIILLFTGSQLLFIISIMFTVMGLLLYKFYITVRLSKITDPDIKIEKYNKLISSEESQLQKAFYLNNLSECHYEKEEYEKALILVREAKGIVIKNDKGLIHIGVPIMDIVNLNESRYLIDLGLFEEASKIMMSLDECRIKNNTYLCCMHLNRADLAVERGFSQAARSHLSRLNEIKFKHQSNARIIEVSAIWIQLKCDVLEKDFMSATKKLNTLIESNTSKHTIDKAIKLKMEIESKK